VDETEARKKRKEMESKWHIDGVRAMGKKIRTRKKREFVSFSLNLPEELHKQLIRRSKKVGCSMSSLVKTYIYNGLRGVGATSSSDIKQTRQQEIKFTPKVDKQPANYQAPMYFRELKEVLEMRKKKKKK
jgi:hypothetical protein